MSPFREYVQIAYQVNPDVKILRGSGAERKIHEQLRIELSRDYHVMHNVLLPNGSKHGFSQIDHLVISKFGIFVLKKKHTAVKYSATAKEESSLSAMEEKFFQ